MVLPNYSKIFVHFLMKRTSSLFHLFPGPFPSIKEILAFENNDNNDKKLYLHESNKYSIIAKSLHNN